MSQILSIIIHLVKSISFQKIVAWTAFTFLAIFCYAIYENKADIVSLSRQQHFGNKLNVFFDVGKVTVSQIKNYVNLEPGIEGFSILTVDMRLNYRSTLYHFNKNAEFKRAGDVDFLKIYTMPLFSNDTNANRQVIKLINGQYFCEPYRQALIDKAALSISTPIKTVCSVSLPPYYGNFSGYIQVYLSDAIDPNSDQQLKQRLLEFSTNIYFRDVIPTSRSIKIR